MDYTPENISIAETVVAWIIGGAWAVTFSALVIAALYKTFGED